MSVFCVHLCLLYGLEPKFVTDLSSRFVGDLHSFYYKRPHQGGTQSRNHADFFFRFHADMLSSQKFNTCNIPRVVRTYENQIPGTF